MSTPKSIISKGALFKNKDFNILIKLLIAALMVWVLYKQVFAKEGVEAIWESFVFSLSNANIHWLWLTLLLMPINLALETIKWQQLVKQFEVLPFWKSFQAILTGITFSIFTPNRIGEYGGRVLQVKPEHNWKAVIATLVGNFSQLLVLLSMGILGFVFFAKNYLEIEPLMIQGMFMITLGLVGIGLFCYFNISLIIPLAKKIPYIHYLKKYVKDVKVLEHYQSKDLAMSLFYSFVRYSVYSLQYYFMLRFFGIDITLLTALAGIATIYLVQTSIPLPPLFDLLLRGEMAIFIFSSFSTNEISILSATFGLWIINLIIPALIGTMLIMNINVLKSFGYENEID